jgi:signal transduction histidine kinase
VLQVAPFDAADMLRDVMAALAPAAQAKRLVFTGATLAQHVPVLGDRRKCFQILLNPANNAVKFTEQGTVRVSLGLEGEAGEWLVMTVTATGIGIAAEHLPQHFQPFRQLDRGHRRAYEGTGLGLYLCRKLAEAMGGSIGVESTPGVGSIFEVRLPQTPKLPAVPAAADLATAHAGSHVTQECT